jgi:DNA-3-methyladenine glycosylase II
MTVVDSTTAIRHLRRVDPVMKALIKTHGAIPLRCATNGFETLASIIIGQQLSGKAADTIFARIKSVAGGRRLTAKSLGNCSDQKLQEAGASRPKIRALRSLIDHVDTKKLRISKLAALSDEQVFAAITQVKGMGPWSAQMYLMFVLGRPDVFPAKDLGIRKAVSQLYGVELTPESADQISAPWKPHRTLASLYLWQSLDNRP